MNLVLVCHIVIKLLINVLLPIFLHKIKNTIYHLTSTNTSVLKYIKLSHHHSFAHILNVILTCFPPIGENAQAAGGPRETGR